MENKNLNIYCDGGARGNPGPAASAFVAIFNEKVVFKNSKFLGIATNNSAEYQAVIIALEWLSTSSYVDIDKEINFYLDSELVARQLSGKYKVKNEGLRPFYYQVKKLEKKIDTKINYHSVPRNKNKLSDYLVNQELDKVDKISR